MPKVSDYELEHWSEDEINFQKVRSKKSKSEKESKRPEKKRVRGKKIDYWDLEEKDD